MYKIKHKETGLYYQPTTAGNNLGRNGKVYTTKTSPLTMEPSQPCIHIHLSEDSQVYKKYKESFEKYKPTSAYYMRGGIYMSIPKSDFEMEGDYDNTHISIVALEGLINEYITAHQKEPFFKETKTALNTILMKAQNLAK